MHTPFHHHADAAVAQTATNSDIVQIVENINVVINNQKSQGSVIADLQSDTAAIKAAIAALSQLVATAAANLTALLNSQFATVNSELDAISAELTLIESEVNPTIPYAPPGQYWSSADMSIVTSINLTGGGSSDGVQCVDSSPTPQVFPGSQITWSMPLSEASPSDLSVALASDGVTFTFTAGASAPTESPTLFATWTDPAGVQPTIVFPPLTVNITAATVTPPPTTFVAPGQYDETSGM
jgi:hypothetical protein